MTEQIEKAVADILQHLDKATPEAVEWVSQTSEWMMGVWVKQTIIQGELATIAGVIVLLVGVWLFIHARKLLKDDARAEDGGTAACIAGCIFAGIASVVLLTDGIPRLLNPEYYALQKWLQLFGRY